jgi:hypothetical protein
VSGSALSTWVEPRSIADARSLAEAISRSGLAPQNARSAEAVMVILAQGAELGLPPMAALRQIHVVSGRAVLSADLMRALVLRMGGRIRCVESTPDRATFAGARGEETEQSITWTMQMAQRAGLTGKGPWQQYPAAMLRARASAELCRLVWPDVVGGLYTPDEMGEARDVRVEAPAPSVVAEEVVDAEVVPVEAPAPAPAPAPTPTTEPVAAASAPKRSPKGKAAPLPPHVGALWATAQEMGLTADDMRQAAREVGVEPRALTPEQCAEIVALWRLHAAERAR